MSWTFNPPPGWPRPAEGWQPPPGWAPDPSWPPAPPGWQFWVPTQAPPAQPAAPAPVRTVHEAPTAVTTQPVNPYRAGPAGPPYQAGSAPIWSPAGPPAAVPAARRPWHRRGWAVGAAALVVLLSGCLAGTTVALLTDPDQPAAAPSGPTAPPTPAATGPAGSGGLAPGQERTGEGAAIVALDLPTGGVHTVTLSFTGTDYFEATLVDGGGGLVGFLGSGSGDYTGTHLLGEGMATTGDPAAAVDIVAADGGSWAVLVQDLADAPAWPFQTEGTGNVVLRIDPGAVGDPIPVTGTHAGVSNFIVWAYSEVDFGDRLLFNEIGAFSGASQELLTSEAFVLAIQADGEWTLQSG